MSQLLIDDTTPVCVNLIYIYNRDFFPLQALQQHPVLPTGLTESLKVNHLASAGTNVYKIVLSQLSVHAWHQHFLHIICDGLHCQER